jgi:hypothetical protein
MHDARPAQPILTREMLLLLECCRWPPRAGAIADIFAQPVDYDRFCALVRRHRVAGLVHAALAGQTDPVAIAIAEELQPAARDIARQNMMFAAESRRLLDAMAARDIAPLFVKGVTVARLAYGSLSVKSGWDIDVLLPLGDVAAAADVLRAAGYACTIPGNDRARLIRWHATLKESVWRHRSSGVHVELHTALVDNPALLAGVGANSPARWVDLGGGMRLPTLGEAELFAYLCVHGAASGWRRLKWLADLAALIAPLAPDALESLHDRAVRLGAGRTSAQGLLLCERFMGTPLPTAFRARLRRDRVTRLLAAIATRIMTAPDGYDDPAETRFGTLPIHLSYMLLLPGWRFTVGEVVRKVRAARLSSALWDPRGEA